MRVTRRHFIKGLVAGLAAPSLASFGGLVGPDGVTPLRRTASAASGADNGPRAQPQLLHRAGRDPDRTFRVIVQRRNKDTRADAAVAAAGGRKLHDMAVDAFVAEVKGRSISALVAHPAVKYACIDSPMLPAGVVDTSALATVYPRAAAATGAWAGALTGLGVGVAVLDTGITGRADFNINSTGQSRLVASAKFNKDTPGFGDGYGHGTHVAGIIAGNSWNGTTAVKGKYVGIAPEANLINVKVADDQGGAYLSDMVNAIEWVIANRTTYNIRVMNISMVQAEPESYRTSILCAAVERAWFSGIFVVVSAGNAGPGTALYPPANDPFVLTVGASDPVGTVGVVDDTIAPWSSYGVSQDGVVKPDLVAPGRYIVAPMCSGTAPLFVSMQSRIVDSTYIWLSGTSMAAPVVAGLAAQIFQAHPEWTNDQVKWLLMNTAVQLGTTTLGVFTPHAGQGAGAVQGGAAIAYTAAPQYANQGLTISAQLVGPDGSTTYTSSSWSSSSWSSSSWSSSSWSSSSWSSSSWSSSSWTSAQWSNALE